VIRRSERRLGTLEPGPRGSQRVFSVQPTDRWMDRLLPTPFSQAIRLDTRIGISDVDRTTNDLRSDSATLHKIGTSWMDPDCSGPTLAYDCFCFLSRSVSRRPRHCPTPEFPRMTQSSSAKTPNSFAVDLDVPTAERGRRQPVTIHIRSRSTREEL